MIYSQNIIRLKVHDGGVFRPFLGENLYSRVRSTHPHLYSHPFVCIAGGTESKGIQGCTMSDCINNHNRVPESLFINKCTICVRIFNGQITCLASRSVAALALRSSSCLDFICAAALALFHLSV